MKILAPLAMAIAITSLSAPAFAQFQKPEDAIKYRKAAFTVMASHFGRVGAMANGRVPFDPKVAADSAAPAAIVIKPASRLSPKSAKIAISILHLCYRVHVVFRSAIPDARQCRAHES